jgi:hypothetical protein
MFVLLIQDVLTGQQKVVNQYFSSQQSALDYATQNNLIVDRILSAEEYQLMLQNHQNQKLMRQYYQRPQPQQKNQQPQNVMHEEPEEEEPLPQPRPRKPVFVIIRPLSINPIFIHRRNR